jgi:hypothetical protein
MVTAIAQRPMDMSLQQEIRLAGDTVRNPNPPTYEQIKALVETYSVYYRAFHAQCAEEDDYYHLRKLPSFPQNFPVPPVMPATARAIVDVATDHVDVKNISIDVPSTARSTARAEKIARFLQGAWLSIKEPVLRTASKHGFQYGIAFVHPRTKMEDWNDSPQMEDYGNTDADGQFVMTDIEGFKKASTEFSERRKIMFPLVARNIDPQEMLWDDSVSGTKWAIRTFQASVGEINAMFPHWTYQKDSGSAAQWTEYWDDTWYVYMADDEFLFEPRRHGFGFMPFKIMKPARSLHWHGGRPEERYQGILHPIHSLLDEESRLMTQIEAIIRRYAWPGYDFTGDRLKAEAARNAYEPWDGFNIIPTGVEVDLSPIPQVPQDLYQQLGMVQSKIEEATFPNVVRGQRPSGVSSGFHTSVLAGMGRLVFQGVADGAARLVEELNGAFLQLVENAIMDRVTVYARSENHHFDQTISPNDIRGHIENRVMLKAEAPEERERESILGMQLFQAGMISLFEAQKRAGITNPLDEQNRMAGEQLVAELRPEQLEQLRERLGEQQVGQLQQAAGPLGAGAPGGGDLGGGDLGGGDLGGGDLGGGDLGGGGGGNAGQFQAGLSQLQRPGEAGNQRRRVQAQQQGGFPNGLGGIAALGRALGNPGSAGGQRTASGQRTLR